MPAESLKNLKHEACRQRLENESRNLFTHITRLTHRVEALEEAPKQKRARSSNKNIFTPIYPPLPADSILSCKYCKYNFYVNLS